MIYGSGVTQVSQVSGFLIEFCHELVEKANPRLVRNRRVPSLSFTARKGLSPIRINQHENILSMRADGNLPPPQSVVSVCHPWTAQSIKQHAFFSLLSSAAIARGGQRQGGKEAVVLQRDAHINCHSPLSSNLSIAAGSFQKCPASSRRTLKSISTPALDHASLLSPIHTTEHSPSLWGARDWWL